MTKTLVSVAMFAALIVLLAITQGSQEISEIRRELADLGLRVANLEHAGGSPHATSSDAGLGAASVARGRTMVVASISQSHHTDDNAAQIDQLKRETGALWNTVNAIEDKTAEDFGQEIYAGRAGGVYRGWRGAAGGGIVSTNAGAVGRQVIADRSVRNRYLTQMDIKRQQLDRLQQAATQPKQIILGHDGDTIITLHTKDNLSRALESISIGDVISWTGHRLSVDDGSETWTIYTIKKTGSK